MRILERAAFVGVFGAVLAGPAWAGDRDGDESDLPARFRYALAQPPGVVQPSGPTEPPQEDKEKLAELSRRPPAFGSPGSRWWTFGTGIGYDFNGSTDTNLNLAYSYFIAQDVEFAAETAAWYFNQPGDNTAGLSLSMIFRWHFVNSGPWTVYTDAGIGFLVAGDVLPEGGTSFDLMPRAGVGVTRQLGDGATRLQLGLRWHHISNARIHGDANNPARDQPLVYAGLVIPF